MKTIRLSLSIILSMALMILCCSCGLFGDREYYCNVDEVESVIIIKLDKFVEGEQRYECTVLAQISDFEPFIARLNKIKHSVNWGDPQSIEVGYVVIRIDYVNGDFDELHQNAQYFSRSGKNNYGYFRFDEGKFNKLISDYLTE